MGYIQKENYEEVRNEFSEVCKQIVDGSARIIGRCDISEDLSFLNDILTKERKKYPDCGIEASYLENVILNEFHKHNIKIEKSSSY
jgi:hypothetical protein